MIRFSCADYTFPLLASAQRFSLLQLLGFEYVDIGLFERNDDLTPSQLLAEPKVFARRLKSELERAELQVADIFLQTGIDPAVSAANDVTPAVRTRNREIVQAVLQLCVELDCRHLSGLPGVWHEGVNGTDDFAMAVDEATWRQHICSKEGISYAIEPHMGSICADIGSARSLLDSVAGLTLTLDYGHFVAAGIDSLDVHSLLPSASHIHVRGGARGRLQTSVSESEIDFRGMIRRLEELQYSGFLAMEYVWIDWQGCNRTDNISETILLRRQMAERIELERLRELIPKT